MKTQILMYNNQKGLTCSLDDCIVNKKSKLYSESHIHDEIEILYVLQNTLTCTIDAQTKIVVSAGDIIIFNQNTVHATLSEVGTRYYMVRIPYSFFAFNSIVYFPVNNSVLTTPFRYFTKDNESGAQLKHFITALFSEDANSDLFMQGYITLVVATLQKLQLLPSAQNFNHEEFQKLLPALKYLNTHYKERISSQDIAQQVNFNSIYLERIFKKALGITISDYINTLRINEAKRLLCSSHMTCVEIAEQCAFSSITYFNKIFRKHTLLTPAMYRKFKRHTKHPDTYMDNMENDFY